jgi:hypothetical protein
MRKLDDSTITLSCDETTELVDVEKVWQAFAGGSSLPFAPSDLSAAPPPLAPALQRTSAFLQHPIFNT